MNTADRPDVDLAVRVAKLTAGQRACLDLVDDHATSKEIARELGISRHTVDARLRGAIQTLGVSSRREAAIIYRAASQAQTYHPFAYQPPQIVGAAVSAALSAHENESARSGWKPHQGGDANRIAPSMASGVAAARQRLADTQPDAQPVGEHVADSASWAAPYVGLAPARAPFRLWGGANDLTAPQRVLAILIVTILAMMAFGMFLTGIEALTLLRS